MFKSFGLYGWCELYGKSQQEIELLVHTVNIFFDDLCMQIGVDKCNIVAMASGHLIRSDGIVLSSGQSLSPVDVCKYLGVHYQTPTNEEHVDEGIQTTHS